MKKHFIKSHPATSYGVYVVHAKTCDYDEYDEITVIAKTGSEAEKMTRGYFGEHQYPLKIRKVCSCDAGKSQILTASFNAG